MPAKLHLPDSKTSRLAANTERVLLNVLWPVQRPWGLSWEEQSCFKLSRFTGGSVSVGLSWVTSSFPTHPPSSLYRSQDNRTNVCSILKLYSFSQDKQEVIRLVWCFSNRKSFKTLHKWVEETITLNCKTRSEVISVGNKTGFCVFMTGYKGHSQY